MAVVSSFRCYLGPSGIDEIRKWHDAQSKQWQARFLGRLTALSQLPINEWPHGKMYKPLHRDCDGLGEIRFKADNVQQRPLGFQSGAAEFTIVFPAQEKGRKFVPLNACATALVRKAEVLANRSRSNALWLVLQ